MSFFCNPVQRARLIAGWHREVLRGLTALLALCFAVGCSFAKPRSQQVVGAPNAAAVVAPSVARLLGTVHVIGSGSRFVLLQTPSAAPVAGLVDGQALVCRAAGNVTATLRVSHERRPPFVVADVATGTPNLGDEVFIEPPTEQTSPSPVLPPSVPSVVPVPTPEFRTSPALPSTRPHPGEL